VNILRENKCIVTKVIFLGAGEEGEVGKFKSSKSESYKKEKECTIIFPPR